MGKGGADRYCDLFKAQVCEMWRLGNPASHALPQERRLGMALFLGVIGVLAVLTWAILLWHVIGHHAHDAR